MSFEITYKTDCTHTNCYYSTEENRDKPFFQEMNSLAEEIKGLQQEIESKKAKMVEIANKMIKEDDIQTDDWVTFNPSGEVEVDDEEVNISEEWWDNTYEVESPASDKVDELLEKDWFVTVENQRNGRYCLKVAEGWDFHLENLEWKDDCLQYEGERIDNDYEGSKWTDGYANIQLPILRSIEDAEDLEL